MESEIIISTIENKWNKKNALSLGGMESISYKFGSFHDPYYHFGYGFGVLFTPAPYLLIALWNETEHEGAFFELEGSFHHPLLLTFLADTVHSYFGNMPKEYKVGLMESVGELIFASIIEFDNDTPFLPFTDHSILKSVSTHGVLCDTYKIEKILKKA
jgi:hypothetical protein